MENMMIIENITDNAALNEAVTNLAEVCQKLDLEYEVPAGAEEKVDEILSGFAAKWGWLIELDHPVELEDIHGICTDANSLVVDVCEALGLHYYNKAVNALADFVWQIAAKLSGAIFMQEEQEAIDAVMEACEKLPVYLQEVVNEINKL